MDNIKDVLNQVFKNMTRNAPGTQATIEQAWHESITKDEKKHTKLLGVSQNQLLVCVDSSAWLYQIRVKQNQILEKIKGVCPDIQSISFKLGKVS